MIERQVEKPKESKPERKCEKEIEDGEITAGWYTQVVEWLRPVGRTPVGRKTAWRGHVKRVRSPNHC